ncbi:MAG: glycosyltransferase [Candidatus Peribacteraceae bacterium]|nr:glycosyltransferase [Candidatus Peribacteraceae bacterium]MDD5739323.1 glycosyltransferase [Candidatus Peribacteraceae bacterium]
MAHESTTGKAQSSGVRVAVYMPAYEPKKAHIRAAMESVRAQTCTDWTLLINDDASVREDVKSHVQEYLSDPRITLKRNERNLGIGGNWNACWQGAPPSPEADGVAREREVGGVRQNSEFIAFLFHDDLWEPAYLEKMIAALDLHPSAGFAAANHTYLQEGEVPAAPFYEELQRCVHQNITPGLHEHHEFLRWWISRGFKPNVIGEPSFIVLRRSLMEVVGPFNASMVQFLDSEYWARCLLKADWIYVAEDLGKFRVHPSGMSAVNEGLGRGVFERFQTLQTVVADLPPEERGIGNAALVNALSGMIGQYFARRKQGRNVNSYGSGGLKKFILRHPILLLRAFARWSMQSL